MVCGSAVLAQPVAPRPAEPATVAANRQVSQSLPFADQTDFDDARRGFIATLPHGETRAADGRGVYTMKHHAFIDASAQAPNSVNPSQWRQARLNQHREPQRQSRVPKVPGLV